MTPEEYIRVQNQFGVIGALVVSLPLDEFIAAAEKADVVGPFVDPTLWMKGHDKLGDVLDIARALRNLKNIYVTKSALQSERI